MENNENVYVTKKYANGEIEDGQQKLVDLISKYSIIVFFSQVSTFVVGINFIIVGVMTPFGFTPFRITADFLYLTITLDSIINMVCIYLQFSFSEKHYIKLCHNLDHKLKIKIKNLTISKIQSKLNLKASKTHEIKATKSNIEIARKKQILSVPDSVDPSTVSPSPTTSSRENSYQD